MTVRSNAHGFLSVSQWRAPIVKIHRHCGPVPAGHGDRTGPPWPAVRRRSATKGRRGWPAVPTARPGSRFPPTTESLAQPAGPRRRPASGISGSPESGLGVCPSCPFGVAAPERVLEAARVRLQQLAVVGRKVAHALDLASGLAVLERDQLTDEVEGEKELEVKALGGELAGERLAGAGKQADRGPPGMPGKWMSNG